ncbi:protein-glutamate methylesterase/protein-glutamine glutaminase [Parvularcula oceani]|uniref:protein-glutamate methylesterase/protein-glutamine glutaminase n=1 Tax=Parvularcula oceani TaxID=1247963 RepID=UPI0004E23885|nr:chemotaxis response regulator protein-glutamate methylesterase [Parvularcula oceani]
MSLHNESLTGARPIRVGIVDDSAVMRALIAQAAEQEPGITVVGQAADPYEAREMIKATAPDVITLDVEMPRMNGLDFLEKLMRLRPLPVVMVSSLTDRNAATTIRALELGAVDYVLKPGAGDRNALRELPAKLRIAAGTRPKLPQEAGPLPPRAAFSKTDRIIAIGASTGGVDALMTVLTRFPENCPPTVVVQHMPGGFTASFAQRLNENCAPRVAEAQDRAPLEAGTILLAPGTHAHMEVQGRQRLTCRLRAGEPVSGHRPSVDCLFGSLVELGPRVIGALLTGMGQDGAAGLRRLRDAGAETLAQDEETSVVYGMPRAAIEMGAADRGTPLPRIASRILTAAGAQPA